MNCLRTKSLKHSFLLVSAIAGTILFASQSITAQTIEVLERTRIGGYAEDLTFAASGPLKDKIIILDGYEVYAVQVAKKDKGGPLVKLFDLQSSGIDVFPNGITYIESEGLIAVNDSSQPTRLFLFDTKGNPQGTRTIQYMNPSYRPVHMEGLAYLPPTAPSFPDHLIMVVYDDLFGGAVRLEIMQRNGLVVAEISNPLWPSDFTDNGVGDVAFLAPNQLLLTLYNGTIWKLDLGGNILAGPIPVAGAVGFEGIIQLPDSRIVAAAYPQSLLFFDSNLNRQPASDRNDIIGLNLNIPQGIAWNTDTNRHLIAHDQNISPNGGIAAVPPSLDGASPVVDLSAIAFPPNGFPLVRRMTYLPDDHLIAATHANNPRAILLFRNDGTLDSQVDLAPLGFGRPFAITYIPATDQFAVGFFNPTETRKLHILSRAGTLDRTIDLSCTGIAGFSGVAFFNPSHPSGGQFIILGSSGRVLITDFNGDVLREFNIRVKLGLRTRIDIAAITSGPQAGAFSVIDGSGGEIVVFRIIE